MIVVDQNPHISKIYYAKEYDPKAIGGAPDCYSDNGTSPDSRVARPISPLCHSCPMNEWGSAVSKITGGDVKACNDTRKLAIYVFAENDAQSGLYQFRVPPGSLKTWNAYVRELGKRETGKDGYKIDPSQVITRISWGELNRLSFDMLDELDDAMLEFAADQQDEGKHLEWIGADDKSLAIRDFSITHLQPAGAIEDKRTPPSTVPQKEIVVEQEVEKPATKRSAPPRKAAAAPAAKPAPVEEAKPESALERAKRVSMAKMASARNGAAAH